MIAISEERGTISVAHNGKIFRYDDPAGRAAVKRWVTKALLGETRDRSLLHAAIDRIHAFLLTPVFEKGRKDA